jgi:abortive infection bacteriophage resistance protein
MKTGLSFKEQVELLMKKGLIVNNIDDATTVLSRVNYYKLSGYSLHLKNNDIFYENCTFDYIYKLYLFDKRFSAILFDLFETIEVTLKTQLSNHLALKYGSLSYLDTSIFRQASIHKAFVKEVYSKEKDKTYGKIKFVTHNIDKYGQLPIWVAIEILSFGVVSKLYRNLRKSDQKAIIRGIVQKEQAINVDCASNWFQSIVNQRNRIAHHSRIYNRSITTQIRFLKRHTEYFDSLNIHVRNDSIFALIYIVKEIIGNEDQWIRIVLSLKEIINEFSDVIQLEHIGFPESWQKLLLSKNKKL